MESGSSGRRRLPKLDSAILQNGRLFERLHLTFEPGKLGRSLAVAELLSGIWD
jgi:hypothetical protein